MTTITPVILSGGSGTRLWPLSRSMYPKQFIRFFNGEGSTFLTAALERLKGEAGFGAPLLLAANDHRFLIEDEVRRAGVAPAMIILEPVARSTAPAIAVAALAATRSDPEAVLAVMPSDHAIGDAPRFAATVRRAAGIASQGRLVLLGVAPDRPHTGFGYIRRGASLASPDKGGNGAFAVDAFFEKPDAGTAKRYLDEGGYYWNSGIFVLHAATFLAELERLEPAILEAARRALEDAKEDLSFLRLDEAAFREAPAISIDYAVMEKTKAAAVIPLEGGWSDVGSWSSLWEIARHDEHGNAVQGEALLDDTEGCYVHTEKQLVATIGVRDLVVVTTPDALLVADKGRAEDVSRIVARLKLSNRREHASHVRSYRPWGFFETLALGPRFQVKLLHVNPGGTLSLQMHHHRSEHWVVVQGTARVTVDGTEKLVRENESVYIVATQWHRLENPGKLPLELIEVQTGSYFGEDDIVRAHDVYNRAPHETR